MDNITVLLKYLKKKHYIDGDIETLKPKVIEDKVGLKNPKDIYIRDKITGMGTILLENLDEHYYITTVKIGLFGNVLASAIIHRNEDIAEIAVYAKEGIIPQHLAEKAMDKIKKTFL